MTEVLGYTIANEEKWNRAVFGTVMAKGELKGGVGEKASDEDKLAAYDRLGGLILKGKNKVKTGSFYDFGKKRPKTTKEVKLLFRDLEGNEVELDEDAEIPIEVKAAEIIKEKKLKEANVDYEKKKVKKAKKADDE